MSNRILAAVAVLAWSTVAAFATPLPNRAANPQPATNLSAPALAIQGQGRPMGRRGMPSIDERVARMKTNLNLTDDQAGKVKGLFERQQKEAREWRDKHPQATSAELREHREHMYRQMNEGLKKILTKEQYKKHEEMMRQMRRGRQGPPKS